MKRFACLDYALSTAAATSHLLPVVYHFEFNRSYQITTYPRALLDFVSDAHTCSPELSVLIYSQKLCNAPKTTAHPNGDPEGEYFKCHSGDLMEVFGTWRRMGLPARDQNDTPFTQSIIDRWTSFARTHSPNPSPAYLRIRGYTNTTAEIRASGNWNPVEAANPTMRYLQWPSRQQPLGRDAQCAALDQPIDYYLV
jgi:hypothetical protein